MRWNTAGQFKCFRQEVLLGVPNNLIEFHDSAPHIIAITLIDATEPHRLLSLQHYD